MSVAYAYVDIIPNGYFKARPEVVGATPEELALYGDGTLEPERANQIRDAIFAEANRLTLTPCFHSC